MTVNKAYTLLKAEGYIEIDRRHGAMIRPIPETPEEIDKEMKEQLALLAAQAAARGISREKFMEACAEAVESAKMLGGN